MANPRTASEWAPIIAIVAGWVLILFLFRRSQKARAARAGKTEELRALRRRSSAWAFIGAGGVLTASVVLSWRNVPPGNEPIVACMVAMGAACVLYGVYRLYRPGK